jgi:hypothetical protein
VTFVLSVLGIVIMGVLLLAAVTAVRVGARAYWRGDR